MIQTIRKNYRMPQDTLQQIDELRDGRRPRPSETAIIVEAVDRLWQEKGKRERWEGENRGNL